MKKLLFFVTVLMFVFSGCTQPKQIKTIDNLRAGIIGETTASAKYAAFAQKAKEEADFNVAKLFEAASKAESIHAANHRKVLEGMGEKMEDFTPAFEVKTTAENLQAAIEGETYESNTMYPQFLADAKVEKAKKATQSFNWALDTEKKHQEFYAVALKAVNIQADNTLPVEYAVCPVCGNTYDKSKMDGKCTFCQTKKEKFIVI